MANTLILDLDGVVYEKVFVSLLRDCIKAFGPFRAIGLLKRYRKQALSEDDKKKVMPLVENAAANAKLLPNVQATVRWIADDGWSIKFVSTYEVSKVITERIIKDFGNIVSEKDIFILGYRGSKFNAYCEILNGIKQSEKLGTYIEESHIYILDDKERHIESAKKIAQIAERFIKVFPVHIRQRPPQIPDPQVIYADSVLDFALRQSLGRL
jgi:predicted phosphatase